jgi:hypothetical protein
MRTLAAAAVLLLMAATGSGHAQMNVRLQMEQDTFLLYEAIPVVLMVQNYSARTIELAGTDGKPWLSFLVTDENGNMIGATDVPVANESVLIPSGQTVGYSVDLLPHFQLRHRGNFRVQAYISARGISTHTTPVRFTIMRGRELGSLTRGLLGQPGEREQYRTYVLVARAMQSGDHLYALVRDDANERVFELVSLGRFTPTVKPVMMVDQEGAMHVLFQGGPRAFGYARITSEGQVQERKVLSDYQSTPELVAKEGEINVVGGEQVFPKVERILTEEELNPAPPPPLVKKKPWWKFWGSSTNSAPAKGKSSTPSK